MSTQSKLLPAFVAGFLAAGLAWSGVLGFISDKPVPNGFFAQSILDVKTKALSKIKEKTKMIIVGGSSVAFGIDSEEIQKSTGMEVVNFGCIAGLGPEMILEPLKPSLSERDIVLLCWEYGLYRFDRTDTNITYLNLLFGQQSNLRQTYPLEDRLKLKLTIPASHVREAFAHALNPYANLDLYRCSWNFDTRGNHRSNQEQIITENELKNQPLSSLLTKTVITKDVNEILSEFVRYCREREVKVLASWPNTFAHPDYFDNPTVKANFALITNYWKSLEVPVVGKPSDAMLAAEFFHDTYYHLNSKGVAVRTSTLIKNLKPWLAK